MRLTYEERSKIINEFKSLQYVIGQVSPFIDYCDILDTLEDEELTNIFLSLKGRKRCISIIKTRKKIKDGEEEFILCTLSNDVIISMARKIEEEKNREEWCNKNNIPYCFPNELNKWIDSFFEKKEHKKVNINANPQEYSYESEEFLSAEEVEIAYGDEDIAKLNKRFDTHITS